MSSAPTDHGSAGDWIPIRRLHGVPVGEGGEALTARRDGAGSSVELRVWLTEEARVTEGFAEPPGQVGTGRLQDLEDVFAGNSGHQGSYRGVVFVGGGLDTSVHSGAEVEVSNVGGDCGSADAGCLTVAEARNDANRTVQTPVRDEFWAQVPNDVSRWNQISHLVALDASDLEEFVSPGARFDIEEAEGIGGCFRGGPSISEVETDVATNIDDLVSLGKCVRFVLLEPCHLIDGWTPAGFPDSWWTRSVP